MKAHKTFEELSGPGYEAVSARACIRAGVDVDYPSYVPRFGDF